MTAPEQPAHATEALHLRTPHAHEHALLTDLVMRSKASNGYDAAFMQAVQAELAITPAMIAEGPFRVMTLNGRAVGTVQVARQGADWHLNRLFIDPDCQGLGIGRRLLDWAMAEARRLGASKLHIESDPNAEAFYLKAGAVRTGLAPSGSIPGRMIPLLILPLDDPD